MPPAGTLPDRVDMPLYGYPPDAAHGRYSPPRMLLNKQPLPQGPCTPAPYPPQGARHRGEQSAPDQVTLAVSNSTVAPAGSHPAQLPTHNGISIQNRYLSHLR